MQGFLVGCLIMRAAQRLAIDRDHPLHRFADTLDPLHKTRFKLLGIHEGKDPAKGIMRGHPIGQREQVREPPLLRLAEFARFLPIPPPHR